MKAQGLGATAIAKALGIGRASVYRVLEAGHPVGDQPFWEGAGARKKALRPLRVPESCWAIVVVRAQTHVRRRCAEGH
jgi:hypothetical protein